jgi:DNA-binding FadR family transcriptional regulator
MNEQTVRNNAGYLMPRVKNSNLKVRVQEEIRTYIVRQGLTKGDPLPTEKDISEQLGISRTVIREALNGLELIGLIETRHGVGRFIGKFDVGSMVRQMVYSINAEKESFRNLLEVRITLETSFLLRDLALFTAEDFVDFRDNLNLQNEMIKSQCSEEDLITSHAEFHAMLLRHSDNILLVDLINMFSQVQTHLYWQHQYLTNDRNEYFTIHNKLVNVLELGDSQGLRACLKEHFLEPVEWVRNLGIRISLPLDELPTI